MLQRARLRAKHSLERLPRVALPPRPSITIRIPLPNIALPRLPALTLPRPRAVLRVLLWALLWTLLLWALHPPALLRYSARASGGISRFERPAHSLSCTINGSALPPTFSSALALKTCVDAAHPAWSGKPVHLAASLTRPRSVLRAAKSHSLASARAAAEFAARQFSRAGYLGSARALTAWAARVLAAPEPPPALACLPEMQLSHGGFLLSRAEKEACWDACRELCLGVAARAAAVAAECNSWGRGRGSLGKCWARYSLKRA
ncbi:hypothetical protein EV426DRAFT_588649 [Tirmania nivea]|nr:hypothetical protein EV426DRAFT_588649 [Tirmania nivea]